VLLVYSMFLCLNDVLDSMNWPVCVRYVAIEYVFLLHACNSGEYCHSRLSKLISPRRE